MTSRRSKVGRVARRELWTTITRPGFILSTLALPLFPLFIGLLITLMNPEQIIGGPEPAHVGIVDQSGLLDQKALGKKTPHSIVDIAKGALPSGVAKAIKQAEPLVSKGGRGEDTYRPYPSLEAAKRDLLAGKLTGVIVVPKKWLATGRVEAYRVRRSGGSTASSPFGTDLGDTLRQALLTGRLPEPMVRRVVGTAADRHVHVLSPAGKEVSAAVIGEDVRRFIVPTMSAFFLAVALFTGAGYLLLGLSEEKENRVLELLLASLTPDELLTGKLLGIGSAGLIQFAVWIGVIAVPLAAFAPLIGISYSQILWAVGFFLGGYTLFGALMLGAGAVADTARHSQQLAAVFTLFAMVPFMFNFVIIQAPSGLFSRVLTFIPFTAPITAMFRMSAGEPSSLELGASLAVLAVSAWLAQKGAARLFRVSLLLYGQRPSPRQIARWLFRGA